MTKLLPSAVAEHVQVVPQHLINAYEWPQQGAKLALLRGDPILHLAGCSSQEKPKLIAKFASCTGDPMSLIDAGS